MENKELIMKEVMEDKVESEGLMEEIRSLRQSLEEEQAKSAKSTADYEERLST